MLATLINLVEYRPPVKQSDTDFEPSKEYTDSLRGVTDYGGIHNHARFINSSTLSTDDGIK